MGAKEGEGGGWRGGGVESGVNFPSAKHCCQIAENSAILIKSSGKKYLFAEKFDSGTAIKFSLK